MLASFFLVILPAYDGHEVNIVRDSGLVVDTIRHQAVSLNHVHKNWWCHMTQLSLKGLTQYILPWTYVGFKCKSVHGVKTWELKNIDQ